MTEISRTEFEKLTPGDLKDFLTIKEIDSDVVELLFEARLDGKSFLMAEKGDLKELGIPLGQVLTLVCLQTKIKGEEVGSSPNTLAKINIP